MPKLTPKTGTPVRAKVRSAKRIEPSPPRTRQRSGWSGSGSTASTPAAASPCLAELLRRRDQPPAGLAGDRGRQRDGLGGGGRMGVGDQHRGRIASSLTAPPPGSRPRGRRSPSPALAAPDEGLAVALRPRQPRGGEAADRQAEVAGGRGHREDRLAAVGGVADDAPCPTRSRPSSNWGLTIASISPPGARQSSTAGRILASEMKETSTVARSRREGQVGGLELAGVEPLDHVDPRVLAQPPVELAVGDVERDHPGGAALQQAVGEAAGRGADVEAVEPGDVDAERVERVVELEPAARDEARPLVDDQGRASGSTSWLGRSATGPSSPTRTSPARTAPAAAERDGKSPRSAKTASIRAFFTARTVQRRPGDGLSSRLSAAVYPALRPRCNSLLTASDAFSGLM